MEKFFSKAILNKHIRSVYVKKRIGKAQDGSVCQNKKASAAKDAWNEEN